MGKSVGADFLAFAGSSSILRRRQLQTSRLLPQARRASLRDAGRATPGRGCVQGSVRSVRPFPHRLGIAGIRKSRGSNGFRGRFGVRAGVSGARAAIAFALPDRVQPFPPKARASQLPLLIFKVFRLNKVSRYMCVHKYRSYSHYLYF